MTYTQKYNLIYEVENLYPIKTIKIAECIF